MNIFEIFIIGFGLAMDAFIVSICKNINTDKLYIKKYFIIGLYFGVFQFLMTFLGYKIGTCFSSYYNVFNGYISSILLFIVGFNMLLEKYDSNYNNETTFKVMFPLAIATSIDAFSVGISFSLINININYAIFCIGIITYLLSFTGCFLGYYLGKKINKYGEKLGGIVLIILSIKLFIENILNNY